MRKSAFIWTLSMIALALLFLSIFPTLADDTADFKALLANYPETVRSMLGINLDSIASLNGFYSMEFSFVILCGAIQAMNMGVSILSKEVRERTADFLLVKPVSRIRIVSAKLLAAFTVILLTNCFYYAAAFILANIVKTADFSNKIFFMINLTMFFVQLIFLAIGLIVSVLFRRIRSVLPVSLGFVFGFYMLGALLAVGKNKDALRFLSPFRYFDVTYIIKHAGYEAPYLIIGAAVIVVCIISGYIIYDRKDIHAVS